MQAGHGGCQGLPVVHASNSLCVWGGFSTWDCAVWFSFMSLGQTTRDRINLKEEGAYLAPNFQGFSPWSLCCFGLVSRQHIVVRNKWQSKANLTVARKQRGRAGEVPIGASKTPPLTCLPPTNCLKLPPPPAVPQAGSQAPTHGL